MKPSINQLTAVLVVARTELQLMDVPGDVETKSLEHCTDSLKKGHSGWRSIKRALRLAKRLTKKSETICSSPVVHQV